MSLSKAEAFDMEDLFGTREWYLMCQINLKFKSIIFVPLVYHMLSGILSCPHRPMGICPYGHKNIYINN